MESPPQSSICLVVCYFGKFPSYIDLVFRSCEANPSVNWLIFTDDRSARRYPPNIRVIYTTLQDLEKRVSDKVGFPVSFSYMHLLCHLRPLYGFVFSEELAPYDFWGHCDLDMIFGDLRKFLTEEILRGHDKILSRGHLSLYRNTSKINEYFRLEAPGVPTYKEALKSPVNIQFDEWRGIYRILRFHHISQFHAEFIIDVIPPSRWKRTKFRGYQIENREEQVFYWHQGKIYQAYRHEEGAIMDTEFAYIHFQKRKMPAPEFDPFDCPGFLITPDGFFPYDRRDLSAAEFERYNKEQWLPFPQLASTVLRGLSRRFKRLAGIR